MSSSDEPNMRQARDAVIRAFADDDQCCNIAVSDSANRVAATLAWSGGRWMRAVLVVEEVFEPVDHTDSGLESGAVTVPAGLELPTSRVIHADDALWDAVQEKSALQGISASEAIWNVLCDWVASDE